MPIEARVSDNSLYRWGVLRKGESIKKEKLRGSYTVKNREVATLTLFENDKPMPQYTYFCNGTPWGAFVNDKKYRKGEQVPGLPDGVTLSAV